MAKKVSDAVLYTGKQTVLALLLVFALLTTPAGVAHAQAEALIAPAQIVRPKDSKDASENKGDDKKEDDKKDKGGGGVFLPSGDGSSY